MGYERVPTGMLGLKSASVRSSEALEGAALAGIHPPVAPPPHRKVIAVRGWLAQALSMSGINMSNQIFMRGLTPELSRAAKRLRLE